MKTIILKNNTNNDITISSLGLTILKNENVQIDSSELSRFCMNEELFTTIESNSIIVNNGSKDLTVNESRVFLQPIAEDIFAEKQHLHIRTEISDFDHNHDDKYYTKEQSDVIYSLNNHTHIKTNITDFEHDHLWADITNKPETFLPSNHTHVSNDITDINTTINTQINSKKGQINGLASLDSSGKIYVNQIPATAITDTFVVNSESAMLNINAAEIGDIAIRTDINKSFILKSSDYSIISSWQELLTPLDAVTSVNGKTGVVTLNYSDVGASPLSHTHIKADITDFNHNHLWADIVDKPATFTPSTHNHDDRYYTEIEINNNYYTKTQLNNGQLDNRYYTETEADTLLSNKSNISHNHDDRYYTESESDNKYSLLSHTHDDRYYTKQQVDCKLTQITYATISSNDSSTDVTGSELEQLTNGSNADGLHTHSGLGGGASTLDEAYGDWGNGRIVDVDYGPVELRASGGFAPLKLKEIDYTPNQWLAGGEICFKDQEMWFRDPVRAKWVSFSSMAAQFSNNNNSASGYMYYGSAQTNSLTGFSMPWNGVIIGISGRCQNSPNASVEIRINDQVVETVYWDQQGWDEHLNADWLNIDFNAEDDINIYLSASGNTKPKKPCITLYVRRRL